MKNQTDPARLLEKCRRGDQRGWSELVDRYQSLVYSVPVRMGLRPDDCEDVFQTTFLALSRDLDRIEQPQALPKWLSVTAAREALRLQRANSRTSATETLQETLAVEEASAEAAAIQAEEAEELKLGVSQLDGKCRRLIEALFYSEDATYAGVSEALGMPVGAIGPSRARCLDRLRKILLKNGFFAGITDEAGALL